MLVLALLPFASGGSLEPTPPRCEPSPQIGWPLQFVENRGQWPAGPRYLAQRGTLSAGFEPASMRLALGTTRIALCFEGASEDARLSGAGEPTSTCNFYLGADPERWRAAVPAYAGVRFEQLHPGVDVVVREEAGELEYDLWLAPEAELEKLVLRCEGIEGLELEADGALVLATAAGPLRQTPPRSFEVLPDGSRRALPSRFRVIDERRFGFAVEGRASDRALVVDPGLEWSTFLGGSGPDFIGPVARDATSGDAFVGGTMGSTDFPGFSDPTAGAFASRAFVARLDGTGSVLRWATFLGGWHSTLAYRGLAVDSSGRAVACGQSFSPDFPTTASAFDRTCVNKDAFVFRLNSDGTLLFSTFLGGSSEEEARAVAYDPSGNVVVGGTTSSSDFPSTPTSFDPTYNPPNAPAQGGAHGDMFVARLSADGTQLTYGTFLGGPQADVLEDLVVDSLGFVTVAGWVTGNNVQVFVTTPGAFDTTWNGSQDGAIARLKLDGLGNADLKYASLYGGSSQDNLWALAIDPSNSELVTFAGRSWSNNFPVTAGVVRPTNPPFSQLFPDVEAGIVVRFRFPAAGGGTRVWSTYHHGTRITDVAVNAAGQPIVVGPEAPWDLPTTPGAFQRAARGTGVPGSSFLSRLDASATQYVYQSFLGGSAGGVSDNFQLVPQVAFVTGNTVLVSGQTSGYDFPVTAGVADPTSSNGVGGSASNEGFVLRIALDPDASGDLTATPPTLTSPPDGATFRQGSIGRIEWSAVTDPSGIEAYEYQVSVRADFDKNFQLWRGAIRETEAILPPSVGSSGGLSLSTYFWRVRTVDRAGNLSGWSATRTFTISSTSGQASASAIAVHPNSIVGGAAGWGMLHLYDPAPAGGLVARLSAYHERSQGLDRTRNLPMPVSVPVTVTIPAGAYSVSFPITTSTVTQSMPVTLVATINGVGAQGGLSVIPAGGGGPKAIDVTLRPGTVTGGNPVAGIVTLDAPAAAGGTLVSLASSHPAAASVPASVTVPAGARTASFPVATSPVSFEVDAGISASAGGGSYSRPLYVHSPGLPTLTGMSIAPASVAGGSQTSGTLTFSGPIPLGTWPGMQDAVVRFSSSDPEAAFASPSDEYVFAGSTSHPFGVFTRGVPTARSVTIGAHFDGVTLTRVVSVGAVSATVSSITANVANLKGGEGGVGSVNLAAPVPVVGGLSVALSTNHPELFSSLPTSVFLGSGSTSGGFAFVTNTAASASTPVTITASYGASSANLSLTVGPPSSAAPPLTSIALSPTSVDGGTSSSGTVTLASAAPAGGAVVQLFSGNTSVATVPASVTVSAGATSATFSIATSSVPATTSASIGGLLHLSASIALNVISTAPPPTPSTPSLLSPAAQATVAQPITFDWTDAPNAATYLIQIDNASTFTNPLTFTQTVSQSQTTVSGLPAQRLFWRVRGINSAGVSGPFSGSRRFTAQGAPAAASLSAVSVSPTSVVGGNGASGTVTLTSAAPAGGLSVSLSSSSTSAAVPASVTVIAGATSASFAVTTSSVASSTPVTITATQGSTIR